MSAPLGALFAAAPPGCRRPRRSISPRLVLPRLAQYLPRRAARRPSARPRSRCRPCRSMPAPPGRCCAALGDGFPRHPLSANGRTRRQAQWVARSALTNFPDIIVAELVPGPAGARAVPLFPQPVRLVRFRREPHAGSRPGWPPSTPRCASADPPSPFPSPRRRPHAPPGLLPVRCLALAGPFWRSEERWRARLLLGVVVALNLSLVGMSVLLSYWNREFFNSLQAKDARRLLGAAVLVAADRLRADARLRLRRRALHPDRGLPALSAPGAADPLARAG